MKHPTLSSVQQQFSKALTSNQDLRPETFGVLDQPPVPSSDRVRVYQQAFQIRMLGSLAEDFPICQQTLGKDQFKHLCQDYLEAFPSRSWTLSELGAELVTFIEPTKEGSSWAKRYPFLSALAHYEWAHILAELSESHEGVSELSWLAGLTPEQVQNLQLKLDPSVIFLRSPWRVDPLEEQEQATPSETFYVIYQKSGEAHHQVVTEFQLRLLELMRQGAKVETLLGAIEPSGESTEENKRLIENSFSTWVSEGIISSISKGVTK